MNKISKGLAQYLPNNFYCGVCLENLVNLEIAPEKRVEEGYETYHPLKEAIEDHGNFYCSKKCQRLAILRIS